MAINYYKQRTSMKRQTRALDNHGDPSNKYFPELHEKLEYEREISKSEHFQTTVFCDLQSEIQESLSTENASAESLAA